MPSTSPDLYFDPFDTEIYADPYPTYARLRREAPLYHNAEFGFYALSQFDDVERSLRDHDTFSSAKGNVLEFIQANLEMPSGVFIFEDPPLHTAHRGVLSRVFTPKQMNAIEPEIRAYCDHVLDPLVEAGTFDFVADLGATMPMRVIGMLLGIPEADQESVRLRADDKLRREPGKPHDRATSNFGDPEFFADYIKWRREHPSDDLMTQLLHAEFEDPNGDRRTLTFEEILIFVNILATAGNETTNRTIGWAGKLLADHPDQRRDLERDRSLLPQAVEEILRFEPPAHQACRLLTRDLELHGRSIPSGSIMMLLLAGANRDHRAFPPDGDAFDIRRVPDRHLTFGYGIHFCLGAALARLEVRVALDAVLDRFPEWEVDSDHARLDSSTVRGWASLPAVTSGRTTSLVDDPIA